MSNEVFNMIGMSARRDKNMVNGLLWIYFITRLYTKYGNLRVLTYFKLSLYWHRLDCCYYFSHGLLGPDCQYSPNLYSEYSESLLIQGEACNLLILITGWTRCMRVFCELCHSSPKELWFIIIQKMMRSPLPMMKHLNFFLFRKAALLTLITVRQL
jgi:hypothetical protein